MSYRKPGQLHLLDEETGEMERRYVPTSRSEMGTHYTAGTTELETT